MATKSINKSIVINTQEQLDKLEATLEQVVQQENKKPKVKAASSNVKTIKDDEVKAFFG